MEENYKVYKHTAPNGKVYIGITKRERAEERWGKDGYEYRRGSNPHFSRAINKYGWENIKHEIIIDGLTKCEAEQLEMELIAEYRSNERKYGYNIENGGNCSGTHSKEVREKIRQANLGSNNHNYGKIGSENPKWSRVTTYCDYCGKEILIKKNRYKRSKHHYCSQECKKSDASRIKPTYQSTKVIVKCINCGRDIEKYKSLVRKLNFCDRGCQHDFYKNSGMYSGEKNPNYKHGKRMNVSQSERKADDKASVTCNA